MYTIAQIIQAEAGSNPAGGFAVASTIQNRASSGLFGTSDPTAIVNQRGQFAGNLISPTGPGAVPSLSQVTPQNQAYADAIQNGTLSQYGNPGNALYFQSNQGQPSTVVGGNSANIGGNYFSDQSGQPSSSFVAPQYGASGGSVTNTGDYVALDPSNPSSSNYGDITGYSVAGVNAPAASATSAATIGNDQGTPNLGGGVSQGGGAPINITDLPGLDTSVTGAGTAIQKGATTAGGDIQTAAGGLAGTGASIINQLTAYTSNAFILVALVVMGIIFVGAGLRMFGQRAGVPTLVPKL